MLRYRQPADEVFRDVVLEALDWMIEDLRESSEDPQAFPELLPTGSQWLDSSLAIETLEGLRASATAPELYGLREVHRTLLRDVLGRYCELFNEEPYGAYGSRVFEKYGVRQLDCGWLIASFLQEPAEDRDPRVKRLRPQDLALEPLAGEAQQEEILPASISPWYRRGAQSYPAAVSA